MRIVTRRGARGMALLGVAALGGCMPGRTRPGEEGVFTAEGTASFDSFRCAQSAVSSLGYTVSWYDGGEETLRAERRFDDSAEAYRGYLTVSVTNEQSGRRLFVRGERFASGSRTPIPANPTPRPTPVPTPGVPRVASRGTTRRVDPGPVAGDARRVVRGCSLGGQVASTARR